MQFSLCILINKWHPKLPSVLASFRSCAAELLLGINGDFSPDEYPELKQFRELKIIPLEWKGYGPTKNELAAKAENDWILSVDADEVADENLQKALLRLDLPGPCLAFALKRANYFGGKLIRYGAWGQNKTFIRLYHKQFTSWNDDAVHESIQTREGMEIFFLKGRLKHYTAGSYEDFIRKNRHYAVLSAEKYAAQGKKAFPGKAWISSAFRFMKEYAFQAGFLDGKAGWQIARGNALYTYWKYAGIHSKS